MPKSRYRKTGRPRRYRLKGEGGERTRAATRKDTRGVRISRPGVRIKSKTTTKRSGWVIKKPGKDREGGPTEVRTTYRRKETTTRSSSERLVRPRSGSSKPKRTVIRSSRSKTVGDPRNPDKMWRKRRVKIIKTRRTKL